MPCIFKIFCSVMLCIFLHFFCSLMPCTFYIFAPWCLDKIRLQGKIAIMFLLHVIPRNQKWNRTRRAQRRAAVQNIHTTAVGKGGQKWPLGANVKPHISYLWPLTPKPTHGDHGGVSLSLTYWQSWKTWSRVLLGHKTKDPALGSSCFHDVLY